MKGIFFFGLRYLAALFASAYLFLAGWLSSRNRQLIAQICFHFGIRLGSPTLILQEKALADIAPADIPIRILEPIAANGNVSLLELIVINKIVAFRAPKAVFEIGTFDGRTALNMAANAGVNAVIYTLDLPSASLDNTRLAIASGDRAYIDKESSGARLIGSPYRGRVTQLYGDSASFDFTPYVGKIDLVFVDGSHSRSYVASDTEVAMKLLRPAGGIILWHDYAPDGPHVVERLHELIRHNAALQLRRIQGTSLALMEISK